MPWILRVPLALVAMLLGCTLPLEDKASCDDVRDCLDGRACLDGECTDDACGLTCGALCNIRNACDSGPPCSVTCDPAATDLPGFSPSQCGAQYDLLETDACEVLTCFEVCVETCNRGVDCALVDDGPECALRCQLEPNCSPAPHGCTDLDAGALSCWSRGEQRGC